MEPVSKRPYRFITREPSARPTLTCEVCGATYQPGAHWRTRPSRFCSNPCRMKDLHEKAVRPDTQQRAKHLTPKGYVRLQVRSGSGWRSVMEHRLVMEQSLGRPLTRSERVHHINGDRADNRLENLRLYASQAEHLREAHPDMEKNFRPS